MGTRIKFLSYDNPDSDGLDPIVIDPVERKINNHPMLARWLRADEGMTDDRSKWYCRKSGLALSRYGAPLVQADANFNNQMVVRGDGSNYYYAAAGSGFMPVGGDWSAVVVGWVGNTTIIASRYLFKTMSQATGIMIEPNIAAYSMGGGRGTGVTLSNGPFLVVGGYNAAQDKLLAQVTSKAGILSTSGWGAAQLGDAVSNTDASIRVPYTNTAGYWIDVAEILIFNGLITDDTSHLGIVTSYLKARYGFS